MDLESVNGHANEPIESSRLLDSPLSRRGFVTKAMDGITDADDLERIETEPMRFVFRVDAFDAERGREGLE